MALIVDASGSIGASNFALVKGLVSFVIGNLVNIGETEDRVALLAYSTESTILFHFDDFNYNVSRILQAVEDFTYVPGGGTATGAALAEARQNVFVEAAGWRNNLTVVVVMTDGQSQEGSDYVAQEAHLLRVHTNAEVFAIGKQ